MNPATRRPIDAAMLVVVGVVPAILAAMLVGNEAPAAHDRGVARVLALRAEPWRATDTLLGSVFACVPVGTQAARAALAGGLVAGFAAMVLYVLGCNLLEAVEGKSGLRFVVASIAALAPTLARPWQTEAAAVGGAVSGALLILLPLALLSRSSASERNRSTSWAPVAFALGLALGHEPCVGACAVGGCAAMIAASAPIRRALVFALRTNGGPIAMSVMVGLAPLLIGLIHVRIGGGSTTAMLSSAWNGERGASPAGSPSQYLRNDVGPTLVVLALAGAAIAARRARVRALDFALVVVAGLGSSCAWLGAPAGPTRFGAPLLAAFGAIGVLAGASLYRAVLAVARARATAARASAAMIVLLELAVPVDAADDTLAAPRTERCGDAAAIWNDVAWGTLPPDAVVLITSPVVLDRAIAARAEGEIRADVTVAPLCPACPPPWNAFERDPALIAVWRDVALAGAPTEASLSSVAAARPLLVAYEPSWGSAAARHLVPFSLFDRFATEPRGPSDRRRALEGFAPSFKRLAELTAFDPELSRASASLLRPRAALLAAQSDRALADRTAADAAAFER